MKYSTRICWWNGNQSTNKKFVQRTAQRNCKYSNNNGFILVAADKRTEPIFAVVDEGNFQFEQLEKENNDMFLTFLDNTIYTELENIKKFDILQV